MKIKILFAVIITSLMLTGCYVYSFHCIYGDGNTVEEELDIAAFDAIELNGSFDVVVQYGPTQRVVAIGDKNIIDRLKTAVIDRKWAIELQNGNYCDIDLTIYIILPILKSAEINGSGDIRISKFVCGQNVQFEINGSGDIDVDTIVSDNIDIQIDGSGSFSGVVDCLVLNAEINGSGNIKTRGWADNQQIKIYGSGSYKGIQTLSKKTDVKNNASGDAYINVENFLKVVINGSGNVYYVGYPHMDIKINGSGRIVSQN